MKGKRMIALLLTGAMALSLTAGCGTKPPSEKTSQDNKEAEETGKEDPAEKQAEETGKEDPAEKQAEETGKEDPAEKQAELTDSVLWINTTYAVLTAANGGDIHYIGGLDKTPAQKLRIQNALKSSWDVTDRATADETVEWLLSEGHRIGFQKDMESMKELGYFDLSEEELKAQLMSEGCTEEDTVWYKATMENFLNFGGQAIDAWDYCRALQLLGWYYIADYYTEQEALDKSLEIATTLQEQYDSWEALCESYLRGYNYWTGDDPKDSDSQTSARRGVYDELKSSQENPYVLDWNVELVKTW